MKRTILIFPFMLASCAEFKAGYVAESNRLKGLERNGAQRGVVSANTNVSHPTDYDAVRGGNGELVTKGDRYDNDSLANPYGAGSHYKADGLMNPYSRYGSKYSNESWTNPYATNAPRIYSEDGTYHGKLSANPYDPDSTSNPYGRCGSKYSTESINNPYGAGNPYSSKKYFVVPQD